MDSVSRLSCWFQCAVSIRWSCTCISRPITAMKNSSGIANRGDITWRANSAMRSHRGPAQAANETTKVTPGT